MYGFFGVGITVVHPILNQVNPVKLVNYRVLKCASFGFGGILEFQTNITVCAWNQQITKPSSVWDIIMVWVQELATSV